MFRTSNLYIVFIKENWICFMTRHLAEPDINIIDKKSSFWLWHQTGKPYFNDTIVCWLNRTTEHVVSLNVMWLSFDFVRSRARCGCCFINCLRFQVVERKQADCKMSTKNVNNYKRHFVIFLDNCSNKGINKPYKSR